MRSDNEQAADDDFAEFDAATAGWAKLDTESIFRALISQELRAGRLTRSGRRRIVQTPPSWVFRRFKLDA